MTFSTFIYVQKVRDVNLRNPPKKAGIEPVKKLSSATK